MGPTLATALLLNSKLRDQFDLVHLDTSDHRESNTLGAIDFPNVYLAIKFYLSLTYLIIRSRPALVYIPVSQTTLGYLKDSIFIIIGKLFQRKVVCHLRGGNFKNWLNSASAATRWYVRRIHSLVDGQIVLAPSLKHLFFGIVPEKKLFVVPNGKNIAYGDKPKSDGTIRILFLANIIRTKGVLDALHAAPVVYAKYRNVEFVFGGQWDEIDVKEEIEAYLGHNKMLPIRWLGMVCGKEKYEAFNSADIFLFPTYYPPEGHPWVIVEAMAAGLPIISTDQGAIVESVIDGVNGFIVEKRNPEMIAKKLIALINNDELRRRMGQQSRRFYEAKFTEDLMVKHMCSAFNAVLER